MKYRVLAATTLVAGLGLATAACGSSASSTASAPAASAKASSSPMTSASGATASGATDSGATDSGATAAKDFGPACSSVPKTGAGSFTGMATAPVATAASANPVLSTLVTAVKKAGLVDTLNSASNITVFAPDNAAFAKLPEATLNKVLADKKELTKILTYHVADGRQAPGDLAAGMGLKTLEGGMVTPAMMNGTYMVNKANVVCGNVQTANATVYIIDTVLMPPSS